MKYKQHRVMGREADGTWIELYQGDRGECRTFIKAMAAGERKLKTPIVTRRSVQQWLDQITPHGCPDTSSSPTTTCA